jgi:hypothetical protein
MKPQARASLHRASGLKQGQQHGSSNGAATECLRQRGFDCKPAFKVLSINVHNSNVHYSVSIRTVGRPLEQVRFLDRPAQRSISRDVRGS